MKKFIRFLTVATLLAGVFGVVTTKSDTIRADAAHSSSTPVTVYLDKAFTTQGLGWWETENTYIRFWDGITNSEVKMTQINKLLFSYEIPTTMLEKFTSNSVGFEFFVYTFSSNQNKVSFTGGLWFMENGVNYFKVTTANGSDIQDKTPLVVTNPGLEVTKSGILALNCSTTQYYADLIGTLYSGLNITDKETLQTELVAVSDVTYFVRMVYMLNDAGSTPPAPGARTISSIAKPNIALITLIGTLSLTALAGFYFLKSKKG